MISGERQLFCLPHAGGNAYFFNGWREKLRPRVEVVPIEYSGHGMRMGERLIEDVDELTEDICIHIAEKKRDVPFGLLGYSMGSKLCILVAARLMRLIGEQPETLFLGACAPVHIPENYFTWDSDAELLEKLYQCGGIPMEVMQSRELCELFLPIIKGDLTICTKMNDYRDRPVFSSDMIVYYSPVDGSDETMEQWRAYTTKTCSLYRFSGTHFFIHEHENEILELLDRNL